MYPTCRLFSAISDGGRERRSDGATGRRGDREREGRKDGGTAGRRDGETSFLFLLLDDSAVVVFCFAISPSMRTLCLSVPLSLRLSVTLSLCHSVTLAPATARSSAA